jgi:hypothetical protein
MTNLHERPGRGAPRRLMSPPRRSKRLPALIAITALLVVPASLGSNSDADQFTGVRFTRDGMVSPPGAPAATASAGQSSLAGLTAVMASIDGVDLHIPAREVVLVGYHEASYDDALVLSPIGRLSANDNSTKFTAGVDDLTGGDYTVLSSRDRRQGATTAVDVVLAPGVAVLSPVNGTVTEVRRYELYGRYADTRIEIQPDEAPLLRVVLIHVRGVQVAVGDRLEYGQTTLALEANLFPFSSQIDRYTEPLRYAHVHIEVKPPGSAVTD